MGGQIDVGFDQLSAAIAFIKSGKTRALALASPTRSKTLPDLPTLAESGVTGADASTFTGILAPAKTPGAIVAQAECCSRQDAQSRCSEGALRHAGRRSVVVHARATRAVHQGRSRQVVQGGQDRRHQARVADLLLNRSTADLRGAHQGGRSAEGQRIYFIGETQQAAESWWSPAPRSGRSSRFLRIRVRDPDPWRRCRTSIRARSGSPTRACRRAGDRSRPRD